MADPEKLTLASADEIEHSLAFALRYSGRKRVHDADIFMSEHVARRLAEHLQRSGYVIFKKPPIDGHSELSHGPKGEGAG
jgi:hypothetical protein